MTAHTPEMKTPAVEKAQTAGIHVIEIAMWQLTVVNAFSGLSQLAFVVRKPTLIEVEPANAQRDRN